MNDRCHFCNHYKIKNENLCSSCLSIMKHAKEIPHLYSQEINDYLKKINALELQESK